MTDATAPAAIVCTDPARNAAVTSAHVAYRLAEAAHEHALQVGMLAARRYYATASRDDDAYRACDDAAVAIRAAWERKEAAHRAWYDAWLALR